MSRQHTGTGTVISTLPLYFNPKGNTSTPEDWGAWFPLMWCLRTPDLCVQSLWHAPPRISHGTNAPLHGTSPLHKGGGCRAGSGENPAAQPPTSMPPLGSLLLGAPALADLMGPRQHPPHWRGQDHFQDTKRWPGQARPGLSLSSHQCTWVFWRQHDKWPNAEAGTRTQLPSTKPHVQGIYKMQNYVTLIKFSYWKNRVSFFLKDGICISPFVEV